MKPKYYFCDVWRMHYHFYLGWKWKTFVDSVKKDYCVDLDREQIPDGFSQLMWTDTGTRVVIWTKNKKAYSILAHECLHAANRTLGRAGVRSSFYNDEAQAYLMLTLIEKALV